LATVISGDGNWLQRHNGVYSHRDRAGTYKAPIRHVFTPLGARYPIGHSYLSYAIALLKMLVIDALSLTLSVLGIYGLVLSLRYLIPCYIVPFLSARLNETQQLLSHAKAINAIPPESEHRTHLDLYEYLYF
jgi:hypothetical protein